MIENLSNVLIYCEIIGVEANEIRSTNPMVPCIRFSGYRLEKNVTPIEKD